jgi:recombination protein RecA
MANHALAVLESALRERKLDRTLTTTLPPLERVDPSALAASGIASLDRCLRGGLPRGQLSEIAGPRSAGRTTLLLQIVAAATQRGEIAAIVDAFDRLDVASAAAAGIDLERLLWIRGTAIAKTDAANDLRDRTLDRAVKALNLVLQAGGFGLVALDVADVPALALKRIPFTTWLRVQRTIEGSDTACVLLVPEPLSRSAGGLTLTLAAGAAWAGDADRSRRLGGLDITARVVSPRRRVDGEVTVGALAIDSH